MKGYFIISKSIILICLSALLMSGLNAQSPGEDIQLNKNEHKASATKLTKEHADLPGYDKLKANWVEENKTAYQYMIERISFSLNASAKVQDQINENEKSMPYDNYMGISDREKAKTRWIEDNPRKYEKLSGKQDNQQNAGKSNHSHK